MSDINDKKMKQALENIKESGMSHTDVSRITEEINDLYNYKSFTPQKISWKVKEAVEKGWLSIHNERSRSANTYRIELEV